MVGTRDKFLALVTAFDPVNCSYRSRCYAIFGYTFGSVEDLKWDSYCS